MELECAVEAAWPTATDWEDLALRVGDAVIDVAPELANNRLCASILFTDDESVHALNLEWRDKDKPTNVLSFPMLERDELLSMEDEGPPVMLGDIALALETCASEASEKSISVEQHASHLLAHGLLHLAGHEHETCPEDADAMEALEIKALAQMGIANPYEDLD